MAIDLELEENLKNQLVESVKRFKSTRQAALLPVYDELINSLERGEITDKYMARYLRDTLSLGEKGSDKFSAVLSKLDKLFG